MANIAKLPLTRDMNNLQTLRNSLFTSSLADLVFVAIDFERPQFITNGFQQGCLDTRVGLDTRHFNSTSKFTTSNFITRDDVSAIYRWGTTEKISVT